MSALARLHALRAVHAGSCGAPRGLSSTASLFRALMDKPTEDIKNPDRTHPAYSGSEKDPGREVPTQQDDGSEKEIKWGRNVPTDAQQLKDELKNAGGGLADSLKMGVQVLEHKAREKLDGVKRAVGMDAGPPMDQNATMGAAGKMEHPPYGSKDGDAATSRQHAESKYDEIAGTEKPSWPGEQSVNEKFPDMAQVAKSQSLTPEQQKDANAQLGQELRSRSNLGETAASVHSSEAADSRKRTQDTSKAVLDDAMHSTGP